MGRDLLLVRSGNRRLLALLVMRTFNRTRSSFYKPSVGSVIKTIIGGGGGGPTYTLTTVDVDVPRDSHYVNTGFSYVRTLLLEPS